jgi:hypothetical protein
MRFPNLLWRCCCRSLGLKGLCGGGALGFAGWLVVPLLSSGSPARRRTKLFFTFWWLCFRFGCAGSFSGATGLLVKYVLLILVVLHFRSCICFGSLDLTVCRGLSLLDPKGFLVPALFFQRGFGTWICPCWRSIHSPFYTFTNIDTSFFFLFGFESARGFAE